MRWGQPAPGFSLPSTDGHDLALADFRDRSDVVLVFYCYAFGGI